MTPETGKKLCSAIYLMRYSQQHGEKQTDDPLRPGLMFQDSILGVSLCAGPLAMWIWGLLTPWAELTRSHQSRDAPCRGEQ